LAIAQDLVGDNVSSNPGLALTKLAPPLRAQDWSKYLGRLVDASATKPPSGYDDHFRRLRARTAAGPEFRRVLLATSLAPAICGMGERTPGENGLTLHPVFGVPYLPGTSLKGILQAWVLSQDWGAEWQEWGAQFRALFGEGGHDGAAAVVDILDALPLPGGAMLTLDVLTPHHSDFYQGQSPPLGWEGPNPVQFLAAAKGVRYRVVVEGASAWVGKAAEWLALALAERGVGAKSRAGYGRFSCQPLAADHREEREAAERNAEARRTKAERAEASLRSRGKDAVRGEVEKWLRGDAVNPSFAEALPAPTDSAPPERLAPLGIVGAEWRFREDWVERANNPKADDKKKSRARELIEAWDALFLPAAGEIGPSATVDSIAGPSPATAPKLGSAPWTEPKKGTKPNKLAHDFASRAGRADAPSREAVQACLGWLRAHEGKRGQLNQVRRAYDLEEEP
jgi:CRISPR-associated protein Cmr6